MSDAPRIEVSEMVFDGAPVNPTKPLTMAQMMVFDMLRAGCRPQFIRALSDWLKAGRSTVLLLHAETPGEANVLSLLMQMMDKEREKGRSKLILTQ